MTRDGRCNYECIVVHYGEIALKGRNRWMFEEKLVENIKRVLGEVDVVRMPGRILVTLPAHGNGERGIIRAMGGLAEVFGISHYSPCFSSEREIGRLTSKARRTVRCCMGEHSSSFKVNTSRADKGYPLTSIEVNRRLGEEIREETGLKVDLRNPDLTLYVEILHDRALLYCNRNRGLGGLPVGSSGRVLVLLSGGIDSPVAAWMLAKRGVTVDLLHFYPFRDYDPANIMKIIELVKGLSMYLIRTRLFTLSCGPIRDRIGELDDLRYSTMLFRLFIMRVAAKLAGNVKASAIATGDSLSQVASQTLSNLTSLLQLVGIPVFLPLIGFDKEEIVEIARRIGTYERSTLDYPDCCTMRATHAVATRSSPRAIWNLYRSLSLQELEDRVLAEVKTLHFDRYGDEVHVEGDGPLDPEMAERERGRTSSLE